MTADEESLTADEESLTADEKPFEAWLEMNGSLVHYNHLGELCSNFLGRFSSEKAAKDSFGPDVKWTAVQTRRSKDPVAWFALGNGDQRAFVIHVPAKYGFAPA